MKKLFLMLIATVCVAGAYAQNLQIWTDDDIMYEQSVATIDSITFTDSNAPAQEGTLYKTWECIRVYTEVYEGNTYTYYYGVRIVLSQHSTFSFSALSGSLSNNNWENYGSGTFLRQGNLILLCLTSGEGSYLPTCLVYNNGKLYGGFGSLGAYELQ